MNEISDFWGLVNNKIVVKIEIANEPESPFGTGFFVAKNVVCTAMHNVEKQIEYPEIIDVYWNQKKLSVKKIVPSFQHDLVFLILKNVNNDGWLLFDFKTYNLNEEYYGYGFTNTYNQYGEPVSLLYTGEHKTDAGNPLLVFKGDRVLPGMSGGPVINKNSRLLAGMIIISRSTDGPIGGRGVSSIYIGSEFMRRCPKEFFASFQSNCLIHYFDVKSTGVIEKYNALIVDYVRYFRKQNKKISAYLNLVPYINYYYGSKGIVNADSYMNVARWMEEVLEESDVRYFLKVLINKNRSLGSELIETVINYLSSGILPLSQEIIKNVKLIQNIKNSSLLVGSSCLRQSILFENEGLLVPFEWDSEDGHKSNSSIIEYIFKGIEESKNYIIIADPGMGKTTFCIYYFFFLQEQRINNKYEYIPIYVNLREEVLSDNIGSDIWIKEKCIELYGKEINGYVKDEFSNLILIFDALDEYLAGCSKRDIDLLFSTFVFKKNLHLLITCRMQYFERYLKFHSVIRRFYLLQLHSWNVESQRDYALIYLSHFGKHKNGIPLDTNDTEMILFEIRNSLFLQDLSKTPLYFNMLLELYADSKIKGKKIYKITNLVELYAQFIEYWLEYEREKISSGYEMIWQYFNSSKISELLSRVSWKYYDDALYNRCDYSSFTRQTLEDFLQELLHEKRWRKLSEISDISKITDFILTRTFLLDGKRIAFLHKSFQEFFVSEYIFNLQISIEDKFEKLIEVHEKLITPEVSEFLKGQLLRVDKNIVIKRRIFSNLSKILLSGKGNRVARQQMAYHIGLLNIPESVEFLKNYLGVEKDAWIRRGIIIGLSFSGDESELHKYVERMYKEREGNGDALENNVNIGFSLTFFGDQPYDDLYPDRDQHLPACRNTVMRLIYQLSTEIDRPSWRTNLYTLVDLRRNRKESIEDYINTMKLYKENLEHSLEKMIAYDPSIKQWKEIALIRQILVELSNQ